MGKLLFLMAALLFSFSAVAQESGVETQDQDINIHPGPENAGGAFAENAFAQMGEVEYTHYRRLFDYAMEYADAQKPFAWETRDPLDPQLTAKGQIAAGEAFTNDRGAACRTFSETYTVRETTQQLRGIACKRSAEDAKEKLTGWCKLRVTEVPDCALEPEQGLDALFKSGEQNYYKYKSGLDLFQNNTRQFWDNLTR